MFKRIESLVKAFEDGTMSRRELVARIGAFFAAATGVRAVASTSDSNESTFTGEGLNHIALRVTDVARSRDFYRKHLGLTVLRDGRRTCFMRCGDHFVALFQSERAGMDHYCYTIPNYEPAAAVQTLKTAGLSPERQENRVYFKDPDGLTVQVSAVNDWNDW